MKKIIYVLVICDVLILLAACSPGTGTPTSQAGDGYYLTPYHTATLTPTVTPTPLDQPTQTPKPTITPTPRIYEVRAGDQMLGIAYAFGITLEDLQAANPDVNPSLMSIGTRLIIPPPRGITPTAAAPTPTPFAVSPGALNCLPSATGGLHCFVNVSNERENSATNLTGEFSLTNASNEIALSRTVALPLKRLEPGARLPFYTYFAPSLVDGHTVSFTLLTATRVDLANSNAFPLAVTIEDSAAISSSGNSAVVSGSLALEDSQVELSRVTLVAVAYDAAGNVIGMRRLEEETTMAVGAPRSFRIEVFSISGSIATVEVYAEGES